MRGMFQGRANAKTQAAGAWRWEGEKEVSCEGSRRWSWRSSRRVRQSPLGLARSLAVTLKAVGSTGRVLAGLGNDAIYVFK